MCFACSFELANDTKTHFNKGTNHIFMIITMIINSYMTWHFFCVFVCASISLLLSFAFSLPLTHFSLATGHIFLLLNWWSQALWKLACAIWTALSDVLFSFFIQAENHPIPNRATALRRLILHCVTSLFAFDCSLFFRVREKSIEKETHSQG